MPGWEESAPAVYSVVTGFFPEASPKKTWATNPRPLLVCGTAQDPDSKVYFCRIAYGSTQVHKARVDDLLIGNLSILDQLCLKKPTFFRLAPGSEMVILPWTAEFFRPWSNRKTPVLSRLPEDMQNHVTSVIKWLPDLPAF